MCGKTIDRRRRDKTLKDENETLQGKPNERKCCILKHKIQSSGLNAKFLDVNKVSKFPHRPGYFKVKKKKRKYEYAI